MHRSRTARMVPTPAVLRLSVPGLVLTLLAFAVFACGLISTVSVTAGLERIASPAAVTAQGSPDATGLLVAHATADGDDGASGHGCSKKPSVTEGSPSLRTDSYGSGFLSIARPQAATRLPADRHRAGCAGPAPPAPTPILLSVLRI
ncbi:hypothetical protein [Sphaerimonospora thailandensis]|uniref:Uncharacterized protein n=1 Tax=Sphaerimonospora thailandensis TaxID=795644 RepID=A0A8J3R9P0_9ACTN|nr:hypothetical protein [Sphaerimonospora thailandensis]GIH68593.1 hypothetical protein Mth01_08460 [Sphaerimonospora thailandensis]